LLRRSDHLVFKAKMEGEAVTIIIDLGANRNYTSTKLENKLARFERQKEALYPLTIVDGSLVDYEDG
jgi:hypothetical protein